VNQLPDESGFFVGSMTLPKDHWLYAPSITEWDNVRECPTDTPLPILDNSQRDAVVEALKWAIRGATMNGSEPDFDPDALVQNAVYALCGAQMPARGMPKAIALIDDAGYTQL